jgi:hypothetical protein
MPRHQEAGVFVLRRLEQFDWASPDGKTQATFNVTEMLSAITDGKLKANRITTRIDTTFVEDWLVKRELNMPLCHRMGVSRQAIPVLGVCMPDDSVLLIDGSHRYMAKYLNGDDTIDYMLVANGDWQRFATITGKPL